MKSFPNEAAVAEPTPHAIAPPARIRSSQLFAWRKMRASRVHHLACVTRQAFDAGVRQFVLIGGHAFAESNHLPLRGAKFFRLYSRRGPSPLGHTLSHSDTPHRKRPISVPCDFHHSTAFDALAMCTEYDLLRPALFILEGQSMYVGRHWLVALIQGLKPLLIVPKSQLWLDVAHRCLVSGRGGCPDVSNFVRGMTERGHAFSTGYDDPEGFFQALRLTVEQNVPACLRYRCQSHVFGAYRFLVLSKPLAAH